MGFVGGSVMAANLKSKCSHFGRMKPVCSPLWRKGPVRSWAPTAIVPSATTDTAAGGILDDEVVNGRRTCPQGTGTIVSD